MLYQSFRKGYRHFMNIFLHLRVMGFIALGVTTIFLTFFTEDNALELVISGIASVFIGIGVNNYTVIEDRERNDFFWGAILSRCLENLDAGIGKTNRLLKADLEATDPVMIRRELEMTQLLLENAADFCRFELKHHRRSG